MLPADGCSVHSVEVRNRRKRRSKTMGGRCMLRMALIAAVLGLAMPTYGHAQEIVLRFWDNQQTESGLSQYQQEAVKSFEAENPDIKVEVTTVPYPEYQQRLLTAVQGGTAPDVSTIDQIWVAAFAAAGVIEPLDERVASAKISADTFFPGAWASANYDGRLWGIPFNVDVWQFSFYNEDLLKAAAIDPASLATFEDLKAAGEKLTDEAAGNTASACSPTRARTP